MCQHIFLTQYVIINIQESILIKLIYFLPIPIAVTSKAFVFVLSLAGIIGIHPVGAWMSVCCECCVLSDRCLCVGLITNLETYY